VSARRWRGCGLRGEQGASATAMISEEHQTIFIHVPKCAGVSVRSFLEQCGFWQIQLDDYVEDIRSGCYTRGTAARMLLRADRGLWDRCFKFCVCRNPNDRLVSAWSFCREQGKLAVPFDYFVRYMRTFESFWVVWHCILPQKQHVLIDGVPVIDLACRYERLESDFERVRERLGRPAVPLSHRNRSAHKPYQAYYTRELQDLVFERFRVDFEYFGYRYELDDPAPESARPLESSGRLVHS
jgi:hypothetical protein